MKNLSLALALVIYALFLLPQHALSAQIYKSKKFNLDISGEITTAILLNKQERITGTPKPSSVKIQYHGGLSVEASSILNNGYRVGAYYSLDLLGDFMEYFYTSLSGPFGTFRIGQGANISADLHLYTPDFLAPGVTTVDWSDFASYDFDTLGLGSGPQLGDTTFFIYDETALKLTYISPSIQGFEFGISWTPDPSVGVYRDSGDFVPIRESSEERYIVEHITTVMARFSRKESFGFSWGLSGGYIFGDAPTPSTTPYGYSLGLNFGLGGFEFGGSWQKSQKFNSPTAEDRVWTAGFAYAQETWRIGAAYRQSLRSEDPSTAWRKNKEVELGFAYALGRGFWTSLMFEYILDHNPMQRETNPSVHSYGGGLLLTYNF